MEDAEGGYSQVSFAIEPIQLPIVPLSLFWLHSLHTTASAQACGADRSANGCAAAAAQSGAQTLEVRELAELRRQRAVQVIHPHVPVTARGTARYSLVECPSPHHGTPSCCTWYRSTP